MEKVYILLYNLGFEHKNNYFELFGFDILIDE